MPIYFCNESAIELDVIRLMGVSVKTSDSPIGFFGTGLKFSIATLLRTGHKISLTRAGVAHDIGVESRTIRGEDFSVITLDGERLGFTTQLGRNWQAWQAYRELHSNCLDEGGVISDALPEGDWGTVIAVSGEGVEQAYRDRSSIFLDTHPAASHYSCAIHPGRSRYGFYRGVRVWSLPAPSEYTYNVQAKQELTEDRTLGSEFSFRWSCAEAIESLDDESILLDVIMAPRETFERNLRFGERGTAPRPAFKSVVDRNRTNMALNRSAVEWVKRYEPITVDLQQVQLNALQSEELDSAYVLLEALGCDLERSDFLIVESLGTNVYGCVSDDEIMIDKKTLDKGTRFIASTLYEEWLHKTHGYKDQSRELQSMLFEKLLFYVDMNVRGAK